MSSLDAWESIVSRNLSQAKTFFFGGGVGQGRQTSLLPDEISRTSK